jgi:hypothetical protein
MTIVLLMEVKSCEFGLHNQICGNLLCQIVLKRENKRPNNNSTRMESLILKELIPLIRVDYTIFH